MFLEQRSDLQAGRSSLDEVEKSEGQGLVAGGGWVVREKKNKEKTKVKKGNKKGRKRKKETEEISFS